MLNNISEQSTVYVFTKTGEYSENNYEISKTIFSPSYSMNPHKGDIYFRFNPKNKNVRVHIFDGTRTKFYDQDFGAGNESYGCSFVDINKFINHLIINKSLWKILRTINDVGKKIGIPVVLGKGWE
jgi:hypothetical protein